MILLIDLLLGFVVKDYRFLLDIGIGQVLSIILVMRGTVISSVGVWAATTRMVPTMLGCAGLFKPLVDVGRL